MRAIDYQAPTSLSEAVSIMAANGDRARPWPAARTSWSSCAAAVARPTFVVDTKKIPELNHA